MPTWIAAAIDDRVAGSFAGCAVTDWTDNFARLQANGEEFTAMNSDGKFDPVVFTEQTMTQDPSVSGPYRTKIRLQGLAELHFFIEVGDTADGHLGFFTITISSSRRSQRGRSRPN